MIDRPTMQVPAIAGRKDVARLAAALLCMVALLLAGLMPRAAAEFRIAVLEDSTEGGGLSGQSRRPADLLPNAQEPLRKAQSQRPELPKWSAGSDGPLAILVQAALLGVPGRIGPIALPRISHCGFSLSRANRARAPPFLSAFS
ncbi:hypothetical protein [Gellertiella hungarica]|uniref:Uncharacterized protein n=1 Tax=Gellertiella hungarica TaxID=1572859 RepID=A0A7W6NK35_9HYPH|nr:hypothetical protein [Gellertiella hungarica]MBB4063970.1 hypothetical protein [Gellertiella hungarica]